METNKLYNSDFLKNDIPDNSIDMIFTDPPYKLIGGGCNSKFADNSGMKREQNESTVFSTKGTILITPEIKDYIFELYRVLKQNTYCLIMMTPRQMNKLLTLAKSAGFFLCDFLIMKKSNKVVNPYFFRQCEFIVLFRKGSYKKLNIQGTSNVFEVTLNKGKAKYHPTQKPIKMIETIIKCCSNEGDLILDAFAGSGTTLIAAHNTNRKYLGYEIDNSYYLKALDLMAKNTI